MARQARQDGALAQAHLDIHAEGALLAEGEHQPVPAVAEIELPVMADQGGFAVLAGTKHQRIGRTAKPLGQQAAQQYPAEQVLSLAARLADLMPMAIFVRREL